MGTECINCGWTEAGSLLSHEEYVTANEWTAWLCINYADGTVLPPRASGDRAVLNEDGRVVGYTSVSAWTRSWPTRSATSDGPRLTAGSADAPSR